jgi:hypothetical protein
LDCRRSLPHCLFRVDVCGLVRGVAEAELTSRLRRSGGVTHYFQKYAF